MTGIWFVTGGSAGIGQGVIEKLLADDNVTTVIAGVRTPETLKDQLTVKDYPPEKLQVVKFDLLDEKTIETALTWVDEKYGKIDTFFGCAGIGGDLSEVEGLPREVIDRTFQVNFFGSFKAIQIAVEKWRLKGGFRIVQVSSMVGIHPFPGTGWYGASKAALENLVGTYSQELSPEWNIKVHLIALGAYATRMTERITEYPIVPAYKGTHMETVIRPLCWNLQRPTAEQGAEEILSALSKDNLPLHVIIGQGAEMLTEAEKTDLEQSLKFYREVQQTP